jgi:RecJ-like exonuclease
LLLGTEECDPYTPLIGFTPADASTIKISVRCSKLLVRRDLNMGVIMRNISRKHGGAGGGHAFACGAFVPQENITPFLNDVSQEIGKTAG